MICFLRIGDDYPDDATRCPSIAYAKAEFAAAATELDRYGQRIEASIHIAASKDELSEYPDYVLSLGPRGGIHMERT